MAVRSLAISGTGVAKRPVLATSLAYVRSASRRRTDSSMRLLTWPCQIVAPATSDGGRRSDNELSTSAEGQPVAGTGNRREASDADEIVSMALRSKSTIASVSGHIVAHGGNRQTGVTQHRVQKTAGNEFGAGNRL
ncbi:hypothetical protein AXG93_1054s1500 [Marchantia polymorpha subsp. ruderalis]|uniref:Uncharacterized protein n=1 Tax=Marchantia polymorpha subsp. ruderalis TaxID=1480154 RepID=A0A176WND6_MARPO|nr:hypothetical protein AXG93_1054s1500 [Marchantia polymorpha subsp. ruderalis]